MKKTMKKRVGTYTCAVRNWQKTSNKEMTRLIRITQAENRSLHLDDFQFFFFKSNKIKPDYPEFTDSVVL